MEEVAAEFDGEDPAVPDVRNMLDQTTERAPSSSRGEPTLSRAHYG